MAASAALEAYPLDGELSSSATGTGYASTYASLGFTEVARRSPERPIMRYAFGEIFGGRKGRRVDRAASRLSNRLWIRIDSISMYAGLGGGRT